MSNNNYITEQKLSETLATFGNTLSEQIASQLTSTAAAEDDKKVSRIKALKLEFKEAKDAILDDCDRRLDALKAEYTPKFEAISQQAKDDFHDSFKSVGESIGSVVSEVTKPVAKFFIGIGSKLS